MDIIMPLIVFGSGIFLGWSLREIKLYKNMTRSMEELRENFSVDDYESRFWALFNATDTY